MTFSTLLQIAAGLKDADRQIMNWNKATLSSMVASTFSSLWRATGTPTQAAIPAAVAVCDKTFTGAWNFTSPDTANSKSLYCAKANFLFANVGTALEIHDRLVHMGGLNATLTTLQTVGLVVNASTNNLPARLGKSDLSDLQWWMECYTTLGATSTTFNVGVTYTDASTGTIALSPGVSFAASRVLPIFTGHATGLPIKSIDSVKLLATTGTAGSFGFTVTRELFSIESVQINSMRNYAWSETEMTRIPDYACLSGFTFNNTSTTGAIVGKLKLIHI